MAEADNGHTHTHTHIQQRHHEEETRGHGKTHRTLVPRGEKAAASIMDIFIIGAASRRDSVRLRQSRLRRRRLNPSSPGPIGPAGPPSRHKYWWKPCVYTWTTSPSAVKKSEDLSGRGRPTTAISERIVHQAESGRIGFREAEFWLRLLASHESYAETYVSLSFTYFREKSILVVATSRAERACRLLLQTGLKRARIVSVSDFNADRDSVIVASVHCPAYTATTTIENAGTNQPLQLKLKMKWI